MRWILHNMFECSMRRLFYQEWVKRCVLLVAMLHQKQNFLSERDGVQPCSRGQNAHHGELRMRRTVNPWWRPCPFWWENRYFKLSGTATNDVNTWSTVNEADYCCATKQPRNAACETNLEERSQWFSWKRYYVGLPHQSIISWNAPPSYVVTTGMRCGTVHTNSALNYERLNGLGAC